MQGPHKPTSKLSCQGRKPGNNMIYDTIGQPEGWTTKQLRVRAVDGPPDVPPHKGQAAVSQTEPRPVGAAECPAEILRKEAWKHDEGHRFVDLTC